MGGQAAGAMNASGFSASIKSNLLPSFQHITHSGIFNENSFLVGQRAKKLLQIHHGIGVSNCDLYDLPKRNYFLTLFTKSNTDGEPRTRPINVVVCLDVSGSMSGSLSYQNYVEPIQPIKNRLDLSKDAIKMLYDKLKDDDVFSLVTFHTTAKTIIQSTYKKNLNQQDVYNKIYSKFQSGGTTIKNGFRQAIKNIKNFTQSNKLSPYYEHRIVMLTDVCDNSVQDQHILINQISSQQNINTTIIGVSTDFKSSTCEKLIQIKGFNYFCAVKNQDLQIYLADRFDYNFFPCIKNVQIKLESEQINEIQVYGSCDSNRKYQKEAKNRFIITKMQTGFPSDLIMNKKGQIQMQGGLILVKFKLKNQQQLPHLKLKINLSYKDLLGNSFNQNYQIDKQILSQQYYSEQSVQKGIKLFYYTQTIRNLLKDMAQTGQKKLNDGNKQYYSQKLNKLKEVCIDSKIQELNKVIDIVKNQK